VKRLSAKAKARATGARGWLRGQMRTAMVDIRSEPTAVNRSTTSEMTV
jgi:hypothetical protein